MFKKLALASVVAIALTACGSNGGSANNSVASPVATGSSSDNQQPTTNNQQPTTNNQQPTTNNQQPTNPPITPPANYAGVFWSTDGGDSSKSISSEKFDQLVIEGKPITLANGKLTANNFNLLHQINLTDSYIAAYADPTKKDKDDSNATTSYVFVHGKTTPVENMPKEGIATYVGKAIYGSEILGKFVDGTASLNVDFGKKQVNGTISVPTNNIKYTLPTSTITGNRFATPETSHNDVSGYFYGNNASELSGIFDGEDENRKGFSGAFVTQK